ncbi:MAG TPA: heme biosynthesis HemY N-terminal domain-containing protein [Rhizomicrobium sp.]|nr:heme biosynthesis HemY N-terminal domain-containing protein [Rhizomicrobium sp.]
MRRLAGILIAAALIAAGIAWIANRQGELQFLIDGYEVRMSAGVAIAFLIVFAAIVMVVTRVIVFVLSGPGAIGRWWTGRQTRRGYEALSRGLVAAAAGDAVEAREQAEKVGSLLGAPPLALLLTAQAAQLEGNDASQSASYRSMLVHPETEFLGLRGLFMQAMRAGDHAEAMKLASRAHELKPNAAWATNALFDLKAANGEWGDARTVLEDAQKTGVVPEDVARRRKAVLLTAEALDMDSHGGGEAALKLAEHAVDLSPGLVPAAALAARKLAAAGKNARAEDVIETAWAQSPHPDLAAIYAIIRPTETEVDRARRLRDLARINPDHFESRILEAEQAANLMQWEEARRVLAPLSRGYASARVCALMAEIEQSGSHDAAAAHAWLARAARAPRDAEWRCASCGFEMENWHPVCANCGAFDSLSWTAPHVDEIEMLPGAAHDERLAADAAHAFIARGGDAPTQRPPSRKITVTGPNSEPAFVVLPRPPDDPGPGHDGGIFETEASTDEGGH